MTSSEDTLSITITVDTSGFERALRSLSEPTRPSVMPPAAESFAAAMREVEAITRQGAVQMGEWLELIARPRMAAMRTAYRAKTRRRNRRR